MKAGNAKSALSRQTILAKLRRVKPAMRTRFKVKAAGLFGSFAREEQNKGSDLDLLVEFEEGADLFDLVGLSLFLEEKLHRKVDVVSKGALRPELREKVLQAVVAV